MPSRDQLALVQRLFVRNMVAVRGFVIALMPDLSRVDDGVQETFPTVTTKTDDFLEGMNFRSRAFSIAFGPKPWFSGDAAQVQRFDVEANTPNRSAANPETSMPKLSERLFLTRGDESASARIAVIRDRVPRTQSDLHNQPISRL